jgi:hypothetical protein
MERIIEINRALASSEDMAFDAGYRCGKDGPDLINCHPKWFRSREMTNSWERGKHEAEKANQS